MRVRYCEFLMFSSPIEIEMDYKKAIKRFKQKIETLEGFRFKEGCFVGIKDLNNSWIIKN